MELYRQSRRNSHEVGSALLIAIFALLLISVVGIALLLSTGTDSSLAGNYRTSTSAYYAALAGLEEARGRLLWKNPDCFVNRANPPNCPNPGFIPMAGALPNLGLTDVRYILNPASGETVDPTSANPSNYPDTEYQTEMGWPLSGANVQTILSVSPTAGIPGPAYKWVRINAVTEKAIGLDVNGDGNLDPTTRLVYDPAPTWPCPTANPAPGLVEPNCPGWSSQTAVQALEITSLAVLPSGSKRLLQYVVAPLVVASQLAIPPSSLPLGFPTNANFPAALTLDGNGVSFRGPGSGTFEVNGQDACSTNSVYSIGYTNTPDGPVILGAAIPAAQYKGAPSTGPGGTPPPTSPGVGNLNPTPPVGSLLRPSWMTPSGLDSVVQDITKSADVVFNGPVNANASLTPLGMTPNNPMTIVVNGDLDFNAWHNTGYGLLLVTGTLKYDPDATWNGIVLVIGQGSFVSALGGTGQINGTLFLAQTRNALGLLPALGAASFSLTGGGNGIYYDSCWITGTPAPLPAPIQGPIGYKVLSFREIPLT
jgi:hypothetical protein